jgi:hypothetical protein
MRILVRQWLSVGTDMFIGWKSKTLKLALNLLQTHLYLHNKVIREVNHQ